MVKVVDGRVLIETASLTVSLKDGRNYSANHLSISFSQMYRKPILSFICSGVLTSFPCEEIASVMFYPEGAQHCNECDQQYPGNTLPVKGEPVTILR